MMARTRRRCVTPIIIGLGLVAAGRADQPALDLQAQFERASADFDQAQQIQGDEPARARQLFRSAAQRYESIVATGLVNGRLEFNLANSLLRAGDVGRAVLHYRRARRLIPRDPMLADNLAEARSRCLTAIKPTRRSTLLRSVFFWHYDTALAGRCKVALAIYVAFWVLLALRNFVVTRPVNFAAVGCAALTLTLVGSIGYERWSDRNAPEGVVTGMDVAVYKGPGTGYQRQFEQPLQPGVEFTLRERRGRWWDIRLTDGKTGWIDSANAELITPQSSLLRANQL